MKVKAQAIQKEKVEKLIDELRTTVEIQCFDIFAKAEENYETLRHVYMWRRMSYSELRDMQRNLETIKKKVEALMEKLKSIEERYIDVLE